MGPIGMPELIVIMVIALIIFGPRKLPELGKSLGKAINEFKRASNELKNTLEEEIRTEEVKNVARQQPTPAVASAAAPPPAVADATPVAQSVPAPVTPEPPPISPTSGNAH
jgi:sec-independent protein translocase protein TatA